MNEPTAICNFCGKEKPVRFFVVHRYTSKVTGITKIYYRECKDCRHTRDQRIIFKNIHINQNV